MELHIPKRLKKLKHPKTKTRTTTDDGGIPDWLLFELLLRLPLNSVFACRLISKQWLSMASSPGFIRAYTSRAESQPYWTVVPPCGDFGSRPTKCITPHEIYLRWPRLCEIRLLPRDQPRGSGGYIIVGVSDGLLLYYSFRHTMSNSAFYNFYVSNPITGQWIEACQLSESPLSAVRHGWGFLTHVEPSSSSFALSSYRIVRATGTHDAVTFDVYYSETGAWTRSTEALPGGPGELEMQASGAALDGVLHWAELELGVIAFDPEANPNRRQMRVITPPHDVWRANYDRLCSCRCVEYRGELRYIGGYSGRNFELPGFSIWRRRLGDGEWCIQHKVGGSRVETGFEHPWLTVKSLFIDPCDPDVVFCVVAMSSYNRRFVFSYDLKTGRPRKRPDMMGGDDSGVVNGFPWAHLLVVPPWPTLVAEELLERAAVHSD